MIGKNTFNNSNSTQDQIVGALNNLSASIDALIEILVVDRHILSETIIYAENLTQSDFTPASWTRMQTALRSARNIRVNVLHKSKLMRQWTT